MAKTPTNPTIKKRRSKAIDTSWHPKFIEILSATCNVTLACKGVGVHKDTAYEHKKEIPEFAKEWENAKESAIEILEAEAWQRARKQSDVLMIFLLKAHNPAKYREQAQLDITSGGKPLLDPLASALDKVYGNGKE